MQNLTGNVMVGRYKRAGRQAVDVSLEVTAHVALKDRYGKVIPYLFGTRLDAGSEGNVVLMRADCFKPDSVVAEVAKGFKPIEGLAEGEWFVTPPGNGDSFAFIERVNDPADREWAKSLGGKSLLGFVVEA